MPLIRPITTDDHLELLAVYRDAVLTQAPLLYTPRQVEAWADLASGSAAGLKAELQLGQGFVSCGLGDSSGVGSSIEAFALLQPADRLSLLYCRGRSSRQGRGRALLEAVERLALKMGSTCLRTEASWLSRPLLERLGWSVERTEELIFAGVAFSRFRMLKPLVNSGSHPH